MAKIISVTEHGSNRKLTVLTDKILHFEKLVYNTGEVVTHMTLLENKYLDVDETVDQIQRQISS